jgi:hypothetical protein
MYAVCRADIIMIMMDAIAIRLSYAQQRLVEHIQD